MPENKIYEFGRETAKTEVAERPSPQSEEAGQTIDTINLLSHEKRLYNFAAVMKKLRRIIWGIIIFFFASTIGAVVVYRFVPVSLTPLMVVRHFRDKAPILHKWVTLERISPDLVQAVVASEDNRFMTHHGFDGQAIEQAIEEARDGGRKRGASTISQQTAKNVFLWQGKSWVRKGLEAYFTVLIELIWGKERIMEVYLNSIEMGNGIYGAYAVAKYHFHTTPARLTRSQCALIAASLPNPRRFDSGNPSAYLLRREGAILNNMDNIGPIRFKKGKKK
jgi:monofunctional biosynthetic peptidoglycan transglycosylase